MIAAETKSWRRVVLAAIATIGMGVIGTATAADTTAMPPGPYVGFGVGATQQENTSLNNLAPTGAVPLTGGSLIPGSAHFDTGYNILGSAGYKWHNGLRTELEIGYRHSDLASLNGVPVHGDTETGSLMANVLYDIDTHSAITPYLGGGIGAGYQDWNHVHDATFSNTARMSDTGFQWQLIGGVAVPLDKRFSVFAEYRYIGLDDLHFSPAFFSSTRPIGHYDDRSSNVLVGFRWHLQGGSDVNNRQLY